LLPTSGGGALLDQHVDAAPILRNSASISRDSAISGLRYLPIRAMLRNALFME
jgi:hypothetical protein